MSRLMVSVYALVVLVACSDGPGDEPAVDSGMDAATLEDASTPDSDASTEDASTPLEPDASSEEDDASTPIEPDAGGEPDAGSVPDAGGEPDAGACFIGVPCNPSKGCLNAGDRCYGTEGNGFCAPFAPECGGFVMTECASGLTCIRAGGSSLGFCATWPETLCICRSADVNGFETDGCP